MNRSKGVWLPWFKALGAGLVPAALLWLALGLLEEIFAGKGGFMAPLVTISALMLWVQSGSSKYFGAPPSEPQDLATRATASICGSLLAAVASAHYLGKRGGSFLKSDVLVLASTAATGILVDGFILAVVLPRRRAS
jgi:hypothetical protein